MIEFLHGLIAVKQPTRLVIDIGGVGFGVDVSLRTSEKAGSVGEPVELLTHLHVREEALDLYGFHDAAEKALFLKLIGVSGIGPRLALRILSAVTAQQLAGFIRDGDVRSLTTLKGVGKKTAEVLIASLRTAVSKLDLSADGIATAGTSDDVRHLRDAILALVSLGVKEMQAQEAVRKAARKLGESADTSRLVAQALQEV
jgi:Holliday junction DNA helicase RuvA